MVAIVALFTVGLAGGGCVAVAMAFLGAGLGIFGVRDSFILVFEGIDKHYHRRVWVVLLLVC